MATNRDSCGRSCPRRSARLNRDRPTDRSGSQARKNAAASKIIDQISLRISIRAITTPERNGSRRFEKNHSPDPEDLVFTKPGSCGDYLRMQPARPQCANDRYGFWSAAHESRADLAMLLGGRTELRVRHVGVARQGYGPRLRGRRWPLLGQCSHTWHRRTDPAKIRRTRLFRILNASATKIRGLALRGQMFKVVVLDGNPVPASAQVPMNRRLRCSRSWPLKAGAVRGPGSLATRSEIVSQLRQGGMHGARRRQYLGAGRCAR
jgi:hypothetical protein